MIANYEGKLAEWARHKLGMAYEWGKTDCGTLVREGLFLILDRDPFPYMPGWNSEGESRKIWDEMGGVDHAFLAFGAEKIESSYAQTGDIAVLEVDKFLTAAMAIGDNKLLFASTDKGIFTRNITPALLKLNIRFYRFK